MVTGAEMVRKLGFTLIYIHVLPVPIIFSLFRWLKPHRLFLIIHCNDETGNQCKPVYIMWNKMTATAISSSC